MVTAHKEVVSTLVEELVNILVKEESILAAEVVNILEEEESVLAEVENILEKEESIQVTEVVSIFVEEEESILEAEVAAHMKLEVVSMMVVVAVRGKKVVGYIYEVDAGELVADIRETVEDAYDWVAGGHEPVVERVGDTYAWVAGGHEMVEDYSEWAMGDHDGVAAEGEMVAVVHDGVVLEVDLVVDRLVVVARSKNTAEDYNHHIDYLLQPLLPLLL